MSNEPDRGFTGRFMPCPENGWAHTDVLAGLEVRWSTKRKPGGRTKTHYYYNCGLCRSQVFLNKWKPHWGLNMVDAEQRGLKLIDLDEERRDELLKELGLKRAPPPGQRKKKKKKRTG